MLNFTDFSSLFDKVDLRIKAWDIKISFLCWQASIEITSVFLVFKFIVLCMCFSKKVALIIEKKLRSFLWFENVSPLPGADVSWDDPMYVGLPFY